jgi:hypothetical protein
LLSVVEVILLAFLSLDVGQKSLQLLVRGSEFPDEFLCCPQFVEMVGPLVVIRGLLCNLLLDDTCLALFLYLFRLMGIGT